MKKAISTILSIIILFSLTACSGKAKNDESDLYNMETDYPSMYESSTAGTYMAESPNGYYYINGDFLFYADKKTMEAVPLCNKPNCEHEKNHDSETVYYCNAYLGNGCVLQYIQYYNGKIYTVEGFDSTERKACKNLIEMPLDGSTRKRLTKLSDSSVYGIHRGYFYECVNGKVLRLPLNKLKDEPEIIFESELEDSTIILTAKGKYLYFNNAGSDKAAKKIVNQIICYDTKSKIATQIMTADGESEFSVSPYKSGGAQLLYGRFNNSDITDESLQKIYACDLSGENEKLFKDYRDSSDNEINNYVIRLNFDGTYYYEEWVNYCLDEDAQKAGKFIIYDNNFNKLYEDDKEWLPINYWLTYGGRDHMFISYAEGEKWKIVYAKKSDFANGKFELKTLSETNFDERRPGIKVEK